MAVSNALGIGFLEGVYQRALLVALQELGLQVDAQLPLTVKFRNHVVGEFYADIVVEGRLILELKAVSNLIPEHRAQLMNYLRASGIRVGLLINFGRPKLQWERLVN
jgi:GxxExxY protein